MQGIDLMAYVPGLSVNAQEKLLLKGKQPQIYLNDTLPDFTFTHHLTDDWSDGFTYNMAITRPSFTNLSKDTVRYNDYSYFIGYPTLTAFTRHKGGLDIN